MDFECIKKIILFFFTFLQMEIATVTMWLLTIAMVVGIVLAFRNQAGGKHFFHEYEGLILTAIALAGSVAVGMMQN